MASSSVAVGDFADGQLTSGKLGVEPIVVVDPVQLVVCRLEVKAHPPSQPLQRALGER